MRGCFFFLVVVLAGAAPAFAFPFTPAADETPALLKKEGSIQGQYYREFLRTIVIRIARRYELPAELIWAVIAVESRFRVKARSPAGARGLMQLMPGTARELGVGDSYDPVQNVRGGVSYLKRMINQFGGDWELGLAAYNAGPAAVARAGNQPPSDTTKAYVRSVIQRYRKEVFQRELSEQQEVDPINTVLSR